MKKYCLYEGYEPNSITVTFFFEILEEFNNDPNKEKLLIYQEF